MELKRVLGKDNRQAMDEVVRLHGPDALVVSGHKVNGKFELIVAVDIDADSTLIDVPDTELAMDDPKPPAAKIVGASFKKVLHGPDEPAVIKSSSSSHDSLRAKEIVELFREEIQVLKREIQETRKASAWHMQMANPQTLTVCQKALMDHPMPNRLRTLLIDSLADIDNTDQAEAQLHAILNKGITSATELPEDISGVHAFFGPSGSGKSTLIGKLARMATDGFNPEQIAVISYADQKIGAWNQTQLMASQWGVQCYRANSPDMLKTVLREVANFGCIFIDTSGVDITRHHAEVTQYAPEALIHLVVGTEISRSSVERLFSEGLVWDSVNVTKLDESKDAWVLLDALMQHTNTQLWLESASSQLNRPVKLMDTTKWITGIIKSAVFRNTDSPPHNQADIDDRQENESVSTLALLTGLRASRSGDIDAQQEPTF